jgi:hypothetical protein
VADGAGTTLVKITQIAPIYVTFPIPQAGLAEVREAQAKAPLDVRALSQEGKVLGDGKLTSSTIRSLRRPEPSPSMRRSPTTMKRCGRERSSQST